MVRPAALRRPKQRLADGHSYWVRGNLTSVSGSRKVNQFLAQWAQDQRLVPKLDAPEMVINGFGVLGGNASRTLLTPRTSIAINDDFCHHHGGVIVHLGADFAYNPADETARSQSEWPLRLRFAGRLPCRQCRGAISRHFRWARVYSGAVRELGLYVRRQTATDQKLT